MSDGYIMITREIKTHCSPIIKIFRVFFWSFFFRVIQFQRFHVGICNEKKSHHETISGSLFNVFEIPNILKILKKLLKIHFFLFNIVIINVSPLKFQTLCLLCKQILLLLSAFPFAAGTFFPFTARPSPFSPPRYGYRPVRSPSNNLVPVESPILGLRVLVPRALAELFNLRPHSSDYYPRPPPPFNPQHGFPPPHGGYPPNGFGPNGLGPNSLGPNGLGPNGPGPNSYAPNYPPNHFQPNNGYPPNHFQPNGGGYSPNYFPQNGFPPSRRLPPIDPDSFIHLMRILYPDLIYRPDPSRPDVFAIRSPNSPQLPPLPPPQPQSHLPDQRPNQSEFYQDPQNVPAPNRFYGGDLPPNASQYSGGQQFPSSNLPQRQTYPQQNQPQNHLIIIRWNLFFCTTNFFPPTFYIQVEPNKVVIDKKTRFF